MLPSPLRLVSVLATLFAASLSAQTRAALPRAVSQADRVPATQAVASATPVAVAGHIPAWANRGADTGPVPDAQPLHLTFGIARAPQVQAAFEQLLRDQQDPGSPLYHRWLTPQQIGELYGPTEHDLGALTAWLSARGLAVTSVSPSRIFVEAEAPAGVAATALGTALHTFALNGEHAQAPVTEPVLPASLATIVSYIGGLTDAPLHANVVTRPVPLPTRSGAVDGSTPGPTAAQPLYTTSTGVHYQFPADFNKIYNVTPTLSAGTTGTGQRVAFFSGSRMLASDLTNFESLAGLASYIPNYIVPPGLSDPGTLSDGNQDEATLDFERIYGTAPGAQVDVLIATNALTFTNTNIMLNYEINTLRDPVLNLSFGICEAQVSSTFTRNEDALFSQAAAQGISVFVSSGDSGVAGCATHGTTPPTSQFASTNAFCASSYVTCVGGTEFADFNSGSTYWSTTNSSVGLGSALGYIPEGAMNEPGSGTTSDPYDIFATGGGPSTVIAKPSWQVASGVPADGARDTPDISFSGTIHDGYIGCLAHAGASCVGGQGAIVFGGTSASAPSMAGIAALVNQKLGSSQGNYNPLLYKLYGSMPTAFHDATPASSGVGTCSVTTPSPCNNSTPGPTSLTGGLAGYPLTAGYDLATGLGSLDVTAFLAAAGLPNPTGTLTASANPITIAQSVTFTATVTAPAGSSAGTPTGTVQFFSNGASLGTVTLSNGVATTAALRFSPAASYTITAVYSGSTSYGTITLPALTLGVTNPTAVAATTTLSVSPTSGTPLTSFVFTAKVASAGGSTAVATGTVQFLVDTVPTGAPVALVNGTATYTATALAAGTHSIGATYSGDTTYAASRSNAVSISVTALTSSTAISINPSTTAPIGSVNFVATVTGVSGGPVPTGTVTLFQGTSSVGSLPLANGTVTGVLSGTAASPFPSGTYPFNWVYSGDSVYAGSTSPNATLTVTAAAAGFTMVANPSALTVSRGSQATSSLVYTSTNGFAGSVSSQCAVTTTNAAATPPTCSIAPNPVTLAANGTVTATVTIGTVAPRAVAGSGGMASVRQRRLPGGSPSWTGGVALAALLLALGRSQRRALARLRLVSLLALLAAGLFTLAGCGSGTSTATIPAGGTTLGTYTVMVTGTGSNANSSALLTVTVQ